MSTSNFPTALDTFIDPAPTSKCNATNLSGPVVLHSVAHMLANDAIAALQAKVGINGSADMDSLDYKVSHASGSSGSDPVLQIYLSGGGI